MVGRLHVIRAPRGFGKSTLAAWWAHRRTNTVPLWVSAAPRPCASLDDRLHLDDQLQEAFAAAGLPYPSRGEQLARALGRRHVLVIIDGSEHLDADQLRGAVEGLFDASGNVSVLALMRLDGPAGALRQLPAFTVEITADDLRFGIGEVRELATGLEAEISEQQAAEIVDQTRGWPAMVGAVVTGLASGQDLNWEAGAEFLNRVFDGTHTRAEKLTDLTLSAAGFITPEMAEFVLGPDFDIQVLSRPGSEECPLRPRAVSGGYQSSPFITSAATRILWATSPEAHHRAHTRLSRWHLQHEHPRTALWHAVISGDAPSIDGAIARHWKSYLLRCPDLLAIALRARTRAGRAPDPLHTFLIQQENPVRVLREAREVLTTTLLDDTGPAPADSLAAVPPDPIRAAYLNEWGWAQVLYGMPTSALHSFFAASRYAERPSAVDAECRVGLAFCLAQLGYRNRSKRWLESVPLSQRDAGLTQAITDLVALIWEQDRARPAPSHVPWYDTVPHRLDEFVSQLIYHVYPHAPRSFVRGVRRAWFRRNPAHVPRPQWKTLDRWQLETLRHLGIAPAEELVTARDLEPARAVCDAWVWAQAGNIRAHLLAGNYGDVLTLSYGMPEEIQLLPRPWISILLSRAIAASRVQRQDLATEALHQAVAVAEACSAYGPFHLVPEHELREIASEVPCLLAMMQRCEIIGEPAVSPLSSRQLVLLREVSSGAPLKSVANRLYLSPATVKTQLRSIYKTLEVANRDEAIDRARSLRLLVRER